MLLRSPRAWLSTLLVILSACAAEAPAPVESVAAAAPATSPMGALERPTTPAYQGTILSTQKVGRYHYLELALADGERRWAVTTSEPPSIGAAVRTHVFGTRTDFDSPRLKRRFARLDFATVERI
ncbi:MAG: hypothetical protein JNK45_16980 [Myxococcales bacterium]|nr:hypothetical protein [Myxococcales bacterium]